jgi:hypothetical protein
MRNTTIASHAARMPGDNQAEADAINLNLGSEIRSPSAPR